MKRATCQRCGRTLKWVEIIAGRKFCSTKCQIQHIFSLYEQMDREAYDIVHNPRKDKAHD